MNMYICTDITNIIFGYCNDIVQKYSLSMLSKFYHNKYINKYKMRINKYRLFMNLLDSIGDENFSLYTTIEKLIIHGFDREYVVPHIDDAIAKLGNIVHVKHVFNNEYDFNPEIRKYICRSGSIKSIQYMCDIIGHIDGKNIIDIALSGSIECFDYGMSCRGKKSSQRYYNDIVYNAIKSKSFGLVKHIFEKYPNIRVTSNYSRMCTIAALSGSVDLLRYIYIRMKHVNEYTYSNAALSGSLKCMKFLCEDVVEDYLNRGIRNPILYINSYTYSNAVKSNSFEILLYLHDIHITFYPDERIEWGHKSVIAACGKDSLDILIYLIENKCPYNLINVINYTANIKNSKCYEYLTETIFPKECGYSWSSYKYLHDYSDEDDYYF